jgi:hypothetical protein
LNSFEPRLTRSLRSSASLGPPNNGGPTSSVDAAAPPTDEACDDRARVHTATDIVRGTPGSTDLFSEGPSWALPSGRSSSPSTGVEAPLDA